MEIHPSTAITLDHNEEIPFHVEPNRAVIDLRTLENPQNLGGDLGHFQQGMRLAVDGQELPITPYYDSDHQSLIFDGEIPDGAQLQLSLNRQPVLTFLRDGAKWRRDPAHDHERLGIDDMRMLAISDVAQDHIPTPRHLYAGFDPAKHAPITDLHTHSSAQISNAALIALALEHRLDYPVELLQKLNITLNPEEQAAIKTGGGFGSRFSPTESEKPKLKCEQQNEPCDVIPLAALTPEHRQRLQDQLRVPQDMTLSFSDFDRAYYRFVNPLVKNPAMTRDLILRIARDYQKNGVQYAELSTASMLNLDKNGEARWFKEMIGAVEEAEAETGVKLRFLIGVPRSYGPAKAIAELEKIKYAARHPLIAGVDLLGYESNRTSDFSAVLSHIADWARAPEGTELKTSEGWDFKRDFTIRIHAGETGKNNGNVAEAVNIAERFGIHVRIAHAVNEKQDPDLDKKILALSSRRPPLVSMEFCPSSNLAYNNIQDIRAVPFKRWLQCCKSWFLGSDGAGAIQTTPVQLALAALAGGCTLKQLSEMRANEVRFIKEADHNYALKTQAYTQHYGGRIEQANEVFLKQFAAHTAEVNALIDPKTLDPFHPKLPARFVGKQAVLVAGASGESFKIVTDKMRAEARQAMRMLVAASDPKKVYFVVGRSKSEGVTAALDEAIMEHNEKNPTDKFQVLALTTEDIPDLPRSISWVVPQPGARDNVPDNIMNFMRGTLRSIPGISIFIGGSNFTGDMILKCRQGEGLAYLLMENAQGASQNFARNTSAQHKFSTGKSLLSRLAGLFEGQGPLKGQTPPFREGIDVHDAAQMEGMAQTARRATSGFAARVSAEPDSAIAK